MWRTLRLSSGGKEMGHVEYSTPLVRRKRDGSCGELSCIYSRIALPAWIVGLTLQNVAKYLLLIKLFSICKNVNNDILIILILGYTVSNNGFENTLILPLTKLI